MNKKPRSNEQQQEAYGKLVYGKLPPQAVDMEEAVLGALMVDKEGWEAVSFMQPEMFYKNEHGLIFAAIQKLKERKQEVDILTVVEQLKQDGTLESAGGMLRVVQISGAVANAAHIEHHGRKVAEKALLRDLITAGAELVATGYEDSSDPFDLLEQFQQLLRKKSETSGNFNHGIHLSKVIQQITNANMNPAEAPPVIQIGVPTLDKYDSGGKGEVTFLAGRPGMGKTAFMLWEAVKTAKAGFPVLIISLEMNAKALASRLLARSGNKYKDIKNSRVQGEDFRKLIRSADEFSDLDIYIVDVPMDIKKIKAVVGYYVRNHGVQRVYLDQISHVQGDAKDEYTLLTQTTKGLTTCCKENDIALTILAQLNRKVEERPVNTLWRPRMSDLKQTGRMEEDATTVQLLWRPEYYFKAGLRKFESFKNFMGEEHCSKGYLEVIYAKTRNESPGVEVFTFDGPTFDILPYKAQTYTQDDMKGISFVSESESGIDFF